MTSIKWPTAALPGLTTGISGGLRTDGQSTGTAGVSTGVRVLGEYEQADAGARRLRLGNSLASGLDGALRRLNQAASSFTWPTEGIPFATNSRLATQPAASRADLGVTLPDGSGASGYAQEDKFLSRGFAASTPTTLDPGTYALKLSFGGQSQKLSVSVAAGDTNADVLQAVANAVNGSTLQVDASVRSQTGSNILGPGVIPTGSFLALSVDRTRADVGTDKTPTLTDTSGHLAAALDLSATSSPLSPAQTGTHLVTSLSVARPTTFRTSGFDTEAATTLSPGTYTVAYAAGPASGSVVDGSVDVTVNAGDTWGVVLAHMKSAFGSASAFMVSQLVPAKRVWDSTTDERHAVVDATGLEVALSDPKPGWRLTLSGGDNASATGNILSALGLNVTAQPGSDGRMVIDGRERTSTTGAYTADQGRVALDQYGTFGEVVPVSVLAPLSTLSQGLSDVVTAYNGLRDILTKNADLLRTDLAEDWRTPVTDRVLDLKSLGLVESGTGKALWLNADTFVQALTDNSQAVRSTLLGDSSTGLLPELAQMAQDALSAGAGSLLLPQSAFAQRDPFLASPTPRTESDIEKASQLLDLLDSAPKIGGSLVAGSSTGLASGISSGIGAEPLSWGGGGVLRRKG
ncbi:MAG: hypothetical protein CVU73_14330 [Deltaproteobacteria bacterium HGW-Deltaproteobacteria-8]|jgi:hypothetical protein|nr:MAG: hypothetical protein CVU73_14330 [Deltaproteobacteria bacterium HGW-Deltaproteobacteria-8]